LKVVVPTILEFVCKIVICSSSHILRLFWIIHMISQTQGGENCLNSVMEMSVSSHI
ncbi:Uncharacterized protein AMR48_3481, partial [Leptospira interrogans]